MIFGKAMLHGERIYVADPDNVGRAMMMMVSRTFCTCMWHMASRLRHAPFRDTEGDIT